MYKQLKIDEKWSIEYDALNNDRPVCLLRHGIKVQDGCEGWNNPTVAMFYALMAHEQGDWGIEEYKIWKGLDPEKPRWSSLGFACSTWTDANDLLQYMNRNRPDVIMRVVKRQPDTCEILPLTDARINEITMDNLGNWPSFEAQSWACKVVHQVLKTPHKTP
jgi:hypothetical protein